MQQNRGTKRGAIDSSFAQKRKVFLKKMDQNTSYSYLCGMNDKVGNETAANKEELVLNSHHLNVNILEHVEISMLKLIC